jgi:hypothetical protein
MKTLRYIWLFFLFQAMSQPGSGQKFDLGGFIDSYHAIRLQDPYDFLSSRSRFRAELKGTKGKSSFFSSLNANHNYLLPDRTFIELREAYLDYAGSGWDMRAGRQIIIWGVSDGIRITDIIAPMDFTEFLAREYDDIRMPVEAVKLRIFRNNMKVELVFVPLFQSFIYPSDPENPWNILPEGEGIPPVTIAPAVKPGASLRNSEVGGRISFYLSGFDISLVSLYTWNKMPVFKTRYSPDMDSMLMIPEHHRMGMLGMDFSKPMGTLVLRGEGALFSGEHYACELNEGTSELVTKNVIRTLVGLDWYPGRDWTITGQFSHASVLNFEERMECERNHLLATLGISKKLVRSTLTLSTFAYIDLSSIGYFNRTSAEYSLSDQIRISAGVDLFEGDGGMFGMYSNNSECWIKMKYNF